MKILFSAITEAPTRQKGLSMNDLIYKQAAIDALWKALYTYEDETEKRFQESDELNVGDWIGHRIFVQNMNDIDRQTILNLPSAQPEDWMERNKERILQAGMEGREIEFRIGGRLFAIREKAQ